MSEFYNSFKVLSNILEDGAYANIALSKETFYNQPKVTVITYGVLENFFSINSIIRQLVKKDPDVKVRTILQVGIFSILYLNTPNYAIVNECVNIAKRENLRGATGFINAVLKKVCDKKFIIDKKNPENIYNIPLWLYKKIKQQYPLQYKKILEKSTDYNIEFRLRNNIEKLVNDSIEVKDFLHTFKESIDQGSIKYLGDNAYSVKFSNWLKNAFDLGFATAQSHGSILICKALGDIDGKLVLDACAAPGGKSVYIAECGGIVDSLELHDHRAALIESYALRMCVKLNIFVENSTIENYSRLNKYDVVLVDAPCSGLGVMNKRHDIALRIEKKDIDSLSKLQYELLSNCSKYVKKNSILLYSTCTFIKEENEDIVEKFLANNKNFKLFPIDKFNTINDFSHIETPFLKLLPNVNSSEGFFAAKFLRIE